MTDSVNKRHFQLYGRISESMFSMNGSKALIIAFIDMRSGKLGGWKLALKDIKTVTKYSDKVIKKVVKELEAQGILKKLNKKQYSIKRDVLNATYYREESSENMELSSKELELNSSKVELSSSDLELNSSNMELSSKNEVVKDTIETTTTANDTNGNNNYKSSETEKMIPILNTYSLRPILKTDTIRPIPNTNDSLANDFDRVWNECLGISSPDSSSLQSDYFSSNSIEDEEYRKGKEEWLSKRNNKSGSFGSVPPFNGTSRFSL